MTSSALLNEIHQTDVYGIIGFVKLIFLKNIWIKIELIY